MKKLLGFIQRNFKITLGISLFLFAVMLVVMGTTGACLKTPHASKRIVSLELTYKKEKADLIRNEWQTTQCANGEIINTGEESIQQSESKPVMKSAILHIWADFPFILVYTFLLIVLIAWKNKPLPDAPLSAKLRVNLWLVFIAMGCDVIENIYMLSFLNGKDLPPALFAVPATIKFASLLFVIAYILSLYMQKLSVFAEAFIATLWNNRVSVVGLFIIYFALWKSDQGQDLLLNLNAHNLGPALFYTVLTILAAMNWFLPKYYTVGFINGIPATKSVISLIIKPGNLVKGNEKNIPRIMGVLTFIIPACGILNALETMNIQYSFRPLSPMNLLIVTTGLYVWIIERDFIEAAFFKLHKKNKSWIFLVAIIILFVIICLFGVFNRKAPYQLANLSIGLYIMSFIFCVVTTLRIHPEFYQVRGFKRILNWVHTRNASKWVLIAGSMCILVFFLVNVAPVPYSSLVYSRFLTLPVVFTGIAFYTALFFLLLIAGRYTKINWAGLLIIIAIVMAVVFDNRFHDLYRMERKSESKMQPLEKYIDNWIATNREAILNGPEPYPVFIVNTYGGGIRAAAWTSLVVSYLDSVSQGKFQKHVFAYSGASGGTIGASVMCSLRKADRTRILSRQEITNFYKNDFLTPVLVGLLGRDVFFSTTGWDAIDDRARLQDHIWEQHLSALDSGRYAREFCSLWYDNNRTDYDIPLLFANTYHVESGLKGIMAPVQLSSRHFPQAVDVNEKLAGSGLPFSTASFLSARFPYISPAGKLDNSHHFLDGGLKENSGAETAYELYTLVKERIDSMEVNKKLNERDPELARAYKKIRVYFLSLNNTGNYDPEATVKNLVEFTAPVTALYNNWVGNTLKADLFLEAQMGNNYFQMRPLQDTVWHDGVPFRPVLPLGWQISDYALQRLSEGINYCNGVHGKDVRSNLPKINTIRKLLDPNAAPIVCKHDDKKSKLAISAE
jgi:hypothetical protein